MTKNENNIINHVSMIRDFKEGMNNISLYPPKDRKLFKNAIKSLEKNKELLILKEKDIKN